MMDNIWGNFLIELGFLSLLGMLYYFYQKRRIIQYEEKKGPMVMGYILQSILTENSEIKDPEVTVLIESLDDYLHNRISNPPLVLLKRFAESSKCSTELKDVILEGLKEINDGKE